ncbi:hypothetical protein HELRODRAFT_178564 [Helobdella robusta]|uniref:Uncharacterized protein n=1 Tax=Helobdella robusta TaxID=6412 RepID=T1FDE1_HELRO|nr:hypothetical protein HELRODRAFT_178564 [Helobdella robusta]ESN97114.1 hypothetical protein HELRODRAFT_178564 [Helobdella robusta]
MIERNGGPHHSLEILITGSGDGRFVYITVTGRQDGKCLNDRKESNYGNDFSDCNGLNERRKKEKEIKKGGKSNNHINGQRPEIRESLFKLVFEKNVSQKKIAWTVSFGRKDDREYKNEGGGKGKIKRPKPDDDDDLPALGDTDGDAKKRENDFEDDYEKYYNGYGYYGDGGGEFWGGVWVFSEPEPPPDEGGGGGPAPTFSPTIGDNSGEKMKAREPEVISMLCYETCTLYINGIEAVDVGTDDWLKGVTFKISKPSKLAVLIETKYGNNGGLAIDSLTKLYNTDNTRWRCTTTEYPEWFSASYDASQWSNAVAVGKVSACGMLDEVNMLPYAVYPTCPLVPISPHTSWIWHHPHSELDVGAYKVFCRLDITESKSREYDERKKLREARFALTPPAIVAAVPAATTFAVPSAAVGATATPAATAPIPGAAKQPEAAGAGAPADPAPPTAGPAANV